MSLFVVVFLAAISSDALATAAPEEPADLVINHARIIDGTGTPAYRGNVYIAGDRIVEIDRDNASKRSATRHIDAMGKVLSPGFIDLHSHGSPLRHGDFNNFTAMGVTTISLGQDGSSPDSRNLAKWIAKVHKNGVTPNIAMFIGHGTLRRLAGVNGEVISAKQQQEMENLLSDNLPYVFGMTTGLEYSPALYAKPQEIQALAKIVGREDKLIMSHLRNEDDSALQTSIRELAEQGQYARVHVSHLKSVYGKGQQRGAQILSWLQSARDDGIEISADVYPYTASYTNIGIVFPEWAKTDAQLAIAVNNRRAELETFIRNKVMARNGPQATLFGTPPYTGKTLAQVAVEAGKPFEQVLIDDIGPRGASAAYFVMDDDLQSRLVVDNNIAIASDGSPTGFHPRGHGTFAKVLQHYVRSRELLTLEQAIHKMTGLPAQILTLKQRGVIKEGNFADLVIFEPQQVKANASYSEPHQLASGFEYVLVNGQLVLANGTFSTVRPGRVLQPDK
ncbi:N-acyl-D-amino-acid deacylase family protein [Thalassotalea mangrovi]|uniref:N-acyl-D-amino acid deacylase n=1 Tax=Thalassotalea mangrovi TaxID=2572245 RepID=A0A4U1B673_9GAMM|nr:amidohydrolase family protein [Thalassotalea mangrovi]TKB46024.1 N-acyl-D-amino acid deacylase [Thalassotalea mangrovi]